MLYSLDIWNRFCEKVESEKDDEGSFLLKNYHHFDPPFNFPEKKYQLHKLVSDVELMSKHAFLPLVKVLSKTPRYRYQEELKKYDLETKIRPISFASHFDNYIYGYYSYALNEKYQEYLKEAGFSESILAYRTDLDGKCNIQFANEVFDTIRKMGNCTAIALDIKSYFDNIEHNTLKEKWCKVLKSDQLPRDQFNIYKSLTKYSYINKRTVLTHFGINLRQKRKNGEKWRTLLDLVPDELSGRKFVDKFNYFRERDLIAINRPKEPGGKVDRGIPQGLAISSVLSNIYLIDFDETLFRMGDEKGFTYRRYCDDLVIICPSEMANELIRFICSDIKDKYGLTIQRKKTEVLEFKANKIGKIRSFKTLYDEKADEFISLPPEERNYKNLQYLGFEFNGHNIYVRPSSLSRYYRKMKGRVFKSVAMAYSKKASFPQILKKSIYKKYSHIGSRNFISYVYSASRKYYFNSKGERKEGMNSPHIRKQLSAHMNLIKAEIEKTGNQRAVMKSVKIKK